MQKGQIINDKKQFFVVFVFTAYLQWYFVLIFLVEFHEKSPTEKPWSICSTDFESEPRLTAFQTNWSTSLGSRQGIWSVATESKTKPKFLMYLRQVMSWLAHRFLQPRPGCAKRTQKDERLAAVHKTFPSHEGECKAIAPMTGPLTIQSVRHRASSVLACCSC